MAKHLAATPSPAARPRDAARIGLPAGVLAFERTADGPNGALLVAAALLLLAAAGGSTVLGFAARSATRHA